jgi:hypothetical protein
MQDFCEKKNKKKKHDVNAEGGEHFAEQVADYDGIQFHIFSFCDIDFYHNK